MSKSTIGERPQAQTPLAANDLTLVSRNGTTTTKATLQDVADFVAAPLLAEIARLEGLLSGPVVLAQNTITEDYTIPAGFNAFSISPSVAPGVTVTVPPGAVYVVI